MLKAKEKTSLLRAKGAGAKWDEIQLLLSCLVPVPSK